MMKTINEQFSEDEFEKLKASKGNKSWREWMLEQAGEEE